jgi:hypothetical protein
MPAFQSIHLLHAIAGGRWQCKVRPTTRSKSQTTCHWGVAPPTRAHTQFAGRVGFVRLGFDDIGGSAHGSPLRPPGMPGRSADAKTAARATGWHPPSYQLYQHALLPTPSSNTGSTAHGSTGAPPALQVRATACRSAHGIAAAELFPLGQLPL